MLKCVKCCLKIENGCLKSQTKHPLSTVVSRLRYSTHMTQPYFFIAHTMEPPFSYYVLMTLSSPAMTLLIFRSSNFLLVNNLK